MKSQRKFLAVIAIIAGFIISVAAVQKVPPQFKNLKVLPKDISHEELDKIMDNFNYALGVTCGYCHAKNDSTQRMDPVSDAKPEKEAAREMMRMTYGINKQYFNFGNNAKVPETITCITCHRKNPFPPVDTLPARTTRPKPLIDGNGKVNLFPGKINP